MRHSVIYFHLHVAFTTNDTIKADTIAPNKPTIILPNMP